MATFTHSITSAASASHDVHTSAPHVHDRHRHTWPDVGITPVDEEVPWLPQPPR